MQYVAKAFIKPAFGNTSRPTLITSEPMDYMSAIATINDYKVAAKTFGSPFYVLTIFPVGTGNQKVAYKIAFDAKKQG